MKVILPLFIVPVMLVLFGAAPIVLADIDTSPGAQGYFDQGYSQGKNDKLSGNQYNDYCNPYNGDTNPDSACATFKAGYAAGWAAAGLLYGGQQ
jgi:hypothetical protein